MITTDLLKQFKDSLDICNTQVTQLLQQRQKRELFKNAEDYKLELKACEYYPSEYFKLRIFDNELTLMFNSRLKKYYINLETQDFKFIRKLEVLEFISKNNLEYNPDVRHFNIDIFKVYFPKDYDFENIRNIFIKFCNLYLILYINSDSLFIYNS